MLSRQSGWCHGLQAAAWHFVGPAVSVSIVADDGWPSAKLRWAQTMALNERLKKSSIIQRFTGLCGGQRGIRTLGTLSRTHAFQACAIDHSATCPFPHRGNARAVDPREARLIEQTGPLGKRGAAPHMP